MTLSDSDASRNSSNNKSSSDSEKTFNILLATDIHLGYNETDSITGDDSFNTFEEILTLAVRRDVDFILLGGDLFHKAQPSSNSLNRCIKLLHEYTLGNKTIEFKIHNNNGDDGPSIPFSMSCGVNFKDPNMNVSYPVFSIHGNHDDTVNNLSALDLLSSTGLVNYFGKWQSLLEVNLDPIILEKNNTKIALYGLSHIPDRRLYRLFKDNKVDIAVPSTNEEEYFNILVLHQNRADRGAKNFLTMDLLPKNMNLIVWGHEHDCRIEPEPYNDVGPNGYIIPRYVTQPGSSVATSLCEGEAIEKKVGILKIFYNVVNKEPQFKIETIPLKTVRPFIFKSIELKYFDDEIRQLKGQIRDRVETLLDIEVNQMIEDGKKLLNGHPKQPKLPLLRLRVHFEEAEHLINVKRFGQKYVDKVANPGEILLFKKSIKRLKAAKVNIDDEELNKAIKKREQVDRVETVVETYFNSLTDEKDKLKLFDIKCLSEMCRFIVDKDDDEGAKELVVSQVDGATKYCDTHIVRNDQAPEIIQQFRDDNSLKVYEDTMSKLLAMKQKQSTTATPMANNDSDMEGDEESPKAKPTRGRGSRGGRGTTTRGRGSKANTSTTSAPKTTRGRGRIQNSMNIAQQLSERHSQSQAIIIDDD